MMQSLALWYDTHVGILHGTLHASEYLVELKILVTCRRLTHNQPRRRFSCSRTFPAEL